MEMYAEYNKLFRMNLKICKENEPALMDAEELRKAVDICNHLKEQLVGMLDLMLMCKAITDDIKEYEFERILDEFDTHKLYHAYIEPGELMVWKENHEERDCF